LWLYRPQHIWTETFCEVLTLTKNMRLLNGASDSNFLERKLFSDWVLSVDNGTVGESNDVDISLDIPPDYLYEVMVIPLHLLMIELI